MQTFNFLPQQAVNSALKKTGSGIVLYGDRQMSAEASRDAVLSRLGITTLAAQVQVEAGQDGRGSWVRLWLKPECIHSWAPGLNTLGLVDTLQLDTLNKVEDLRLEIVATMLMGPIGFEFPSLDELESAVRIRCNIVQAARKTALDFQTEEAERPKDCWTYDEDRGFTLLPGVSLIDALIKATQPEVSGRLYSFSCYRATEYVTLLGIAQELVRSHPAMYEHLQTIWRQRAIMSEEFHEVFLREQGSMEQPLPPLFYVPGDRIWFRNPDGASADATGFEGSWVMYLGGGLFTNFWELHKQYTLQEKCVEVYHWRHGLYRDAQGEARIDEVRIKPMIAATLANPDELARVMALMTRYREPRGVYTDAGGCIDATREFARWVRPGTADMVLPTQ